jgi:hypothetical protein
MGTRTRRKETVKVVHVLRKPCSEGTVAANVLKWGTGAMNIDASRIAISASDRAAYDDNMRCHERYADGRDKLGGYDGGWKADPTAIQNKGARWPANLVLQHLPTCEQTGTREEPGYTVNRFTDGMKPFGEGAGHPYKSEQVPPSTVPVWACEEGCPVAALDKQSGVAKPKAARAGKRGGSAWQGQEGFGSPDKEGYWPEDCGGGASRFFKQIKP